MGNSFSRLKKNVKHRLRGRKHEPGRTGSNTAGERVDSSDSPPQPGPRVAAGGHDAEGSGTNVDVRKVHPRDWSHHPEPVPAGGSSDNQQRRKANIDKKEVSQRYSHLDPGVEVAVGGGPSREAERVYSSPSTGEPDSTWPFSFSRCIS